MSRMCGSLRREACRRLDFLSRSSESGKDCMLMDIVRVYMTEMRLDRVTDNNISNTAGLDMIGKSKFRFQRLLEVDFTACDGPKPHPGLGRRRIQKKDHTGRDACLIIFMNCFEECNVSQDRVLSSHRDPSCELGHDQQHQFKFLQPANQDSSSISPEHPSTYAHYLRTRLKLEGKARCL